MGKVGKSEEPKLLYDAIEECPSYMRLLLPILCIPLDRKKRERFESSNPVH